MQPLSALHRVNPYTVVAVCLRRRKSTFARTGRPSSCAAPGSGPAWTPGKSPSRPATQRTGERMAWLALVQGPRNWAIVGRAIGALARPRMITSGTTWFIATPGATMNLRRHSRAHTGSSEREAMAAWIGSPAPMRACSSANTAATSASRRTYRAGRAGRWRAGHNRANALPPCHILLDFPPHSRLARPARSLHTHAQRQHTSMFLASTSVMSPGVSQTTSNGAPPPHN